MARPEGTARDPLQRLAALLSGATPNSDFNPIKLAGDTAVFPVPDFIRQALTSNPDALACDPCSAGTEALRMAIAQWISFRHLAPVDAQREVIPVNGSREALFEFAQVVIDGAQDAVVVCPNPGGCIPADAARYVQATPAFLNALPERNYRWDFTQLEPSVWKSTRLMCLCSPAYPTGTVMTLDNWRDLFALSDHYGFVIACAELHGELYCDEANAPPGALQAASQLGRSGYPRLVVFSSLSKRSRVPGLRSGFIAGDAAMVSRYLRYLTRRGRAMPLPVQGASEAAWQDEAHVTENRRRSRMKMDAVFSTVHPLATIRPPATDYLWLPVKMDDTAFVRRLFVETNVTVMPGSYLARTSAGTNPGNHHVSIALTASLAECVEGARRIRDLVLSL